MTRSLRALSIYLLLLVVSLLIAVEASAQTAITDLTSTPVEGAGHDYIKLLGETVNPANGSVSVRLNFPMPPGRGITIPYGIAYDSNGVHHLESHQYPQLGTAYWDNSRHLMSYNQGWSMPAPFASYVHTQHTIVNYPSGYTCDDYSGYMFFDPAGGLHDLGVSTSYSPGLGVCNGGSRAGGDTQYQGQLPNTYPDSYYNPSSPNPLPLRVLGRDGSVYTFGSTCLSVYSPVQGMCYLAATSIEDRNGNIITVQETGNTTGPNYTDTLGRSLLSYTQSGITVGGMSYQIPGKTVSGGSFTMPSAWYQSGQPADNSCSGLPVISDGNQGTLSQLVLPNGQAYTFYYGSDNPDPNFRNNFGLLSEIDYPGGGWVKYKWKLSDTYNEILSWG